MNAKREGEAVCNEKNMDSVAFEPHSIIMPVIPFSTEEIWREEQW